MGEIRKDIEIVKASSDDLADLVTFYQDVVYDLEAGVNYPGWRSGIYPTKATGESGISNGSIYILKWQGRIRASVTLNHHQEDMYPQGDWQLPCAADQIYCVHTLCVHPDCKGQGFGRILLEFAKERAKTDGMKSLRLDVADQNIPAITLYEDGGFRLAGKVLAEFPGSWLGRTVYRLYEYILPDDKEEGEAFCGIIKRRNGKKDLC